MGKVVVSQFVTVDGVVEDPVGSEKSPYGGWAFQFDRGAEGDQFKFDEVTAAEALLLGRKTYEGFAEAWPSREGEFAEMMNSMPKYVVSTTLETADWQNTTILPGDDLAAEVAVLKAEHEGDILVAGSARLVQSLVALDLVDELRLMVFPVVLGSGKRLFADAADSAAF